MPSNARGDGQKLPRTVLFGWREALDDQLFKAVFDCADFVTHGTQDTGRDRGSPTPASVAINNLVLVQALQFRCIHRQCLDRGD